MMRIAIRRNWDKWNGDQTVINSKRVEVPQTLKHRFVQIGDVNAHDRVTAQRVDKVKGLKYGELVKW